MKKKIYILIQCTWGIPQTLLGFLIFLINIKNKHFFYHGAIITERNVPSSVSLGMQDCGYIPKTGDIIFFDWADKHDGSADHVGIVEKVENGRVYTIEGNSHDVCKQKDYDINSTEIMGYGTPVY